VNSLFGSFRFRRPRSLALGAIAACLLAPSGALAAEPPPSAGAEVQLFVENDVWAHTDRYYTSGLKLGVGHQADVISQALKLPSQWLLDRFSDGAETHFGLFFGQNLYTPKRIEVAAPQPFDRPWSAWLYAGAVVQRERGEQLDSAEFDLGMVGPAALGEAVQTRWHKLVGSPRPLGWDNQGRSELAFLASYLHKRKLGGSRADLVPHAGFMLGTVMTAARAGGIVRLGANLGGFGPDSIEPGGAMLQNTRRGAASGGRPDFEWYAFLGVDHRLVARNIFLDGPLFRDGPGVERRTHVFDASRGLSLRYKWLRLSLTRVRRSEEFATPLGGGGKQVFHSLNVGLEF
jgi:hypothetical protein